MSRIHYIAMRESTGYGIAGHGLVNALRELGVEVWITSILAGNLETGGVEHRTQGPLGQVMSHFDDVDFDSVIVHTVPEYYPYWLAQVRQHSPRAKVWGYTAWETDHIPDAWPTLLNRMDGIFVPSAWNKEVFIKSGVTTRIEVLPHVSEFEGVVPKEPLSAYLERTLQKLDGCFLFYTIGVWNERKAPSTLIEAFLQEFSRDEPVALVVKTGERDWTSFRRRWIRMLRRDFGTSRAAFRKLVGSRTSSRVIHIADDLSPPDIAWLHVKGDCFISSARGEGWGMGAYEAAWFGNPVAMTGVGGSLDFLPELLSYHMGYRLVPVRTAWGSSSYSPNQRWAEVDVRTVRSTMRRVYEQQSEAREKGRLLGQYVRKAFDRRLIAKRCLEAVIRG